MSDKAKLVKRLEKLLPTALADQVAEEVVDSLWLAEHDEEVRAGVVAEEPRIKATSTRIAWQNGFTMNGDFDWVPVKQEGAE